MTAEESFEPRGMTRRDMLRGGLAAAAWSVPVVMAVRPGPAAAGTPAPGTPAPDGGRAAARREGGMLARTGGNFGWLVIAAAAATGTGGAALKRARTLRARASGAEADAGVADAGETDVVGEPEAQRGSARQPPAGDGPAGGGETDLHPGL